jgi:hypothetical protein
MINKELAKELESNQNNLEPESEFNDTAEPIPEDNEDVELTVEYDKSYQQHHKLDEVYTWEQLGCRCADMIEKSNFLEKGVYNRKRFLIWFRKREKLGLNFDWHLVGRLYFISRRLERKYDHFTVIVGHEGCVVGETKISININNSKTYYPISSLYNMFKDGSDKQIFIYSYDEDKKEIIKNKILGVVYSGEKKVYRIELEEICDNPSLDNKEYSPRCLLSATSDHKIMTTNGWVELQDLTYKDEVMVVDNKTNNIKLYRVKLKEFNKIKKTYDIQCEEPYHNFIANDIIIHNSGKSTLAMNIVAWTAPDIELDCLIYDKNQYLRALEKYSLEFQRCGGDENQYKTKRNALLIDEGGTSLFSRESLSGSNKDMVKTFMIQRMLMIHVVICIPNYWDLDVFIRTHRINTLILIKERGEYKCAMGNAIKIINNAGKKDRNKPLIAVCLPYGSFFEGHCSDSFPDTINKDEYANKKLKYLIGSLKELNKQSKRAEKESEKEELTLDITDTAKIKLKDDDS